ncbi:MAG: hypothetical protein DYG92_06370 [Leptolyngbya sp. PLA1]|nr:hypothetical protein [Leptolyngbya sp. PLA1]
MTSRRTTSPLIIPVLLAAGLSGTSFAQATPVEPPAAEQPVLQEKPASASQPTISVDFTGGTVEQYALALRAAATTQPVNIVVSKAAARVELAPIQLRDVTLSAAVEAIRAAGEEVGSWLITDIGRPTDSGALVWLVDYRARPTKPPAQQTAPESNADLQRIEVFSLKQVIEADPNDPRGVSVHESPEVVLAAVEATLAMTDEATEGKPELKFHKDSGLLIVRAGPRTLAAISSVVESIRRDVTRRRDSVRLSMPSPAALAQAKAQVARAQVVFASRERELSEAAQRVQRLKQLRDAGGASEEDARSAAAGLAAAESALRMAQIEFDAARQQYDSMTPDRPVPEAAPAPGRAVTVAMPLGDVSSPAMAANMAAAARGVCRAMGVTLATDPGKPDSLIITGDEGSVARARDVLGAVMDELRASGKPAR